MAIALENHTEIGQSRVPEFLRKPRILGLLTALYLTQLDELEAAYLQLANERTIEDSEGVNLDLLGAIIGAPRTDDIGDTVYRRVLRATVLVNRSRGTAPELYEIARVFFGDADATGYKLVEEFPAAFRLEATKLAFGPEGLILARLLRRAKGAAIGFYLEATEGSEATTFQVAPTATTTDTDAATGLDWTDGYGTGGQLAYSLDGTF